MLRMFVTGWSPYSGGPGMPQRARTSSRPTSVVAHDQRNWSGKMAPLDGCPRGRNISDRSRPYFRVQKIGVDPPDLIRGRVA